MEVREGGDTKMGLTLVCGDLRVTDCPFVVRGETLDELTEVLGKHLKGVHGYTDKKLQEIHNKEMMEKLKATVKQE
jgi:predicted small metal-binding protein